MARIANPKQDEAERHIAHYTQQGVSSDVVRAVLPMLCGPSSTHARADAFLRSARTGIDYSPEGKLAQQQLVNRAKTLTRQAFSSGRLDAATAYKPLAALDEETALKAWGEQSGTPHYPGMKHNAETLAVSGHEEAMKRKHRNHTATVDPKSGDVHVADPTSRTGRRKVDHVDLKAKPKPTPRGERRFSADLSTGRFAPARDAELDENGWPTGADRPFFADQDF